MSECPFCDKMARGGSRHASATVDFFAPLNPVTEGHLLFVPREHAEHPNAKALAEAMHAAQSYAGLTSFDYNLITSSGRFATQTVDHLHVHYVPRRHGDGLPLPWTPQQAVDERAKVGRRLSGLLGRLEDGIGLPYHRVHEEIRTVMHEITPDPHTDERARLDPEETTP